MVELKPRRIAKQKEIGIDCTFATISRWILQMPAASESSDIWHWLYLLLIHLHFGFHDCFHRIHWIELDWIFDANVYTSSSNFLCWCSVSNVRSAYVSVVVKSKSNFNLIEEKYFSNETPLHRIMYLLARIDFHVNQIILLLSLIAHILVNMLKFVCPLRQ